MNGIVVINKPAGLTSHQVVKEIRTIFPGVKVGHSGTLDPIATGILTVCLGKATRIAEYIMELPKVYRAGIALGEVTDTDDSAGEVIEQIPVSVFTQEQVEEIVQGFEGEIEQTPPAYSAVKYQGKPLYHWTRRGREVPRQARKAYVYRIELLDYNPESKPHLIIEVECSKGTYIRTLAADLGRVTGTGGHLYFLERSAVGPMSLNNAYTPEELKELAAEGRSDDAVLPMDFALRQFPALSLDERRVTFLKNGRPVDLDPDEMAGEISTGKPVRIYDTSARFKALARADQQAAGTMLKTLKYLSD